MWGVYRHSSIRTPLNGKNGAVNSDDDDEDGGGDGDDDDGGDDDGDDDDDDDVLVNDGFHKISKSL